MYIQKFSHQVATLGVTFDFNFQEAESRSRYKIHVLRSKTTINRSNWVAALIAEKPQLKRSDSSFQDRVLLYKIKCTSRGFLRNSANLLRIGCYRIICNSKGFWRSLANLLRIGCSSTGSLVLLQEPPSRELHSMFLPTSTYKSL